MAANLQRNLTTPINASIVEDRILLSRPRLACLDQPGSSVPAATLARALDLFSAAGVGVVVFGNGAERDLSYDGILHIHAGGDWRVSDGIGSRNGDENIATGHGFR